MTEGFRTISLEEEIADLLEKRARQHNRSINQEVKTILQDSGILPKPVSYHEPQRLTAK